MIQDKRKTESQNPATCNIDSLSTLEMLRLINQEDQKVASVVATQLPQISCAVDEISSRLRQGGRLFYCGAGTSGRLGILDASECTPTYNAPPWLVQALIAGGKEAVFHAIEGAEDDSDACRQELVQRGFCSKDVLVGIAASGTTPYVLGGLSFARGLGALTIGISCNEGSPVSRQCDIAITPVVGPEVITGSTRMKAGTAQKLVLNMLSTGTMIRLGKVYGNLMVDMQVSNAKLEERACRIVAQVAKVDEETATQTLKHCDGEVKTAIVKLCAGLDVSSARSRLVACDGIIRKALETGKENYV